MPKLKVANELIDWWTLGMNRKRAGRWFTKDFIFDAGLEILTTESFLWQIENTLPWSDVRVLDLLMDKQTVAAFFEGVEGVTLLRQRIAWLICFQGELVCSIRQARSTILYPESRSASAND